MNKTSFSLSFSILFLLVACNDSSKKVPEKTPIEKPKDTVAVEAKEQRNDPAYKDFKRMNPNLISDYDNILAANFQSPDSIVSTSESDGDLFAKIYEDLLKERNSGQKFERQYEQILSIYKTINEIFAMTRFGSGYGHDALRLGAKVQYFIYKNPAAIQELSDTTGLWKKKHDKISDIQSIIERDLKDLQMNGKEFRARKKLIDAKFARLEKQIFENWHLAALSDICSYGFYN